MKFDVVIIGAGHAGCEAAVASAKLGLTTAIITLDKRNIGFMPCNPSIGGTAKGHLVCEIDALGGIMGIIADKTAIQIRMLNEGKGNAVASLRAQIDKDAYHSLMQKTLESTKNLTILEDEVTDIITTYSSSQDINNHYMLINGDYGQGPQPSAKTDRIKRGETAATDPNMQYTATTAAAPLHKQTAAATAAADIPTMTGNPQIVGVRTKNNGIIDCSAVVAATGVYLKSKTFVGALVKNEGPSGFPPANSLTQSLVNLGLEIRRFKTGTPARILKQTINFDETAAQHGNDGIRPFSFIHSKPIQNAALCHLTYTNPTTHQIIRQNIKKSAMYGGLIVGVGPRYCPSIEDKVMRFADKDRHQIFLEPETLDGDSIYLQGMSTSLPADIQKQFIQTIDGLRNADIIKCGYAIEYDCINSLQLRPTLEYKGCGGLFFAGQVNGTSGYEEAAAQGLVAGINAALHCKAAIYDGHYDTNKRSLCAVSAGVKQPPLNKHNYNGGLVLSRTNSYIGVLIDDLTTVGTNEPYRMFTARAEHRLFLRQDNADARLTPIGRAVGLVDEKRWAVFQKKQTELQNIRNSITEKERERLKKPNEKLCLPRWPKSLCDIVLTEIKYAGYLTKEESKIAEARRQENTKLPPDLDYAVVRGLRKEAQIKLNTIKPLNVGIAARISGVTPADIAVLLIYLKANNAVTGR